MKGFAWKCSRYATLMAFVCVAAACGDPYSAKLPDGGQPTPAQAQKLAEPLPAPDKDVFLRWAKRIGEGKSFSAEVTPFSVKHAIRNQIQFEAMLEADRQEEEKRRTADQNAKQIEAAKIAEARRTAEAIADQRQRVNAAIQKSLQVKASTYEFRPIFNNQGYEVGRQWIFNLELSNFTDQEVIGLAGWVSIKDAFGKELGAFPIRIEPTVPAGKTINFSAVMLHDRQDPSHVAMTQARTFFPVWFLESVAFKNGTRVDASSVPRGNTSPASTPAGAGKST